MNNDDIKHDCKGSYLTCSDAMIGKEKAIADLAGRPDLYEKYFSKFIENYSDSYSVLRDLIYENKISEAERAAHSIKGLSRTLGLLPLGDAAEMLEFSLKEKLAKDDEGKNSNHICSDIEDNINKSLTIFQEKFNELLVCIRQK